MGKQVGVRALLRDVAYMRGLNPEPFEGVQSPNHKSCPHFMGVQVAIR